jgi:hypothetical protein
VDTENGVQIKPTKRRRRTSQMGLLETPGFPPFFPQDPLDSAHEDDNNEDKDKSAPRYQSNRAAAMLAKTRLSIGGLPRRNTHRGDVPVDDEEGASVSVSGSDIPNNKGVGRGNGRRSIGVISSSAPTVPQWVACDSCSKWRKIPSFVNTDALPEQWYCEMNIWDENRNNCDASEEVNTDNSPIKIDTSETEEIYERTDSTYGRGRGRGRGRFHSRRGGYNGRGERNIDNKSTYDNEEEEKEDPDTGDLSGLPSLEGDGMGRRRSSFGVKKGRSLSLFTPRCFVICMYIYM